MQKWLLLPARSHVSQEPDLLTSATKSSCHSLFLPLALPACPRRREQDFPFCASAELFTSLVSRLQLGGGPWDMMRKCPWGVGMASCQRHSAFLLRGGDLVQCLSGSGKWQAAVVSEPSSFLAFIPAKHLCPRLSAPPREPCLQRDGWLGNPTVAKPRAVTSLLAPHHAASVLVPMLWSRTWGVTVVVPASRCTRLTQDQGSKPAPGAVRMFDAEQPWSDCDSSVPSQVQPSFQFGHRAADMQQSSEIPPKTLWFG